MKTFRLFKQLVGINIKNFLEYRASFFISFFLTSCWVISYIVFVEVLFYNIDSLAGLSKGQILLILSFYYLFQTIGNIFYRDNFEDFAETMRRGELDFILTKPVPHRMMTFLHKMRLDFISSFAIVAVLMIYSYNIMDINFAILPFMLGIVYALLGTIIFYCILSIIATFAFWISKNETFGVLIWNLSQISRYPKQIFNKFLQYIFTFILPFAILANIPAEIATQIVEPAALIYTVVITIVIYILSLMFWNFGIKRYTSAN